MTFNHLPPHELERHIANFEADRANWDRDDELTYMALLAARDHHGKAA